VKTSNINTQDQNTQKKTKAILTEQNEVRSDTREYGKGQNDMCLSSQTGESGKPSLLKREFKKSQRARKIQQHKRGEG